VAAVIKSTHASQRRLNILILHANDELSRVRRTSFNHAFCLLKYAPEHSYELHAFGWPITQRLRQQRFDAIILDTTFLCWRWALPRERTIDRILADYAFVADSDAVKIALPQDEYDHSAVLDDWLAAWRVDLVYSVCYAHRAVFYPKTAQRAEIVEGLTGFIDDADVAMLSRLERPFSERAIEVGYRARRLPPYFGRFGLLKTEIGERFLSACAGSDLKLDISLDPGDALVGDDWLHFLADCRFTLGCESGSSLLDPTGAIRAACLAYSADHPEVGFAEVEAACFPGQDMQRVYSAISPRLFEAALADTCQILVPGDYLGVLNPDEHYIPLEADFSNIEMVKEELPDWPRAQQRATACRAALLGSERLTYRGFVRDLIARIERKQDEVRRLPADIMPVRISDISSGNAERMHRFTELAVRIAENGRGDAKETQDSNHRQIAEELMSWVRPDFARLEALLQTRVLALETLMQTKMLAMETSITDLRLQNAAMRESTSWKITAPFRALAKALRSWV
jgi:hypothetical protein